MVATNELFYRVFLASWCTTVTSRGLSRTFLFVLLFTTTIYRSCVLCLVPKLSENRAAGYKPSTASQIFEPQFPDQDQSIAFNSQTVGRVRRHLGHVRRGRGVHRSCTLGRARSMGHIHTEEEGTSVVGDGHGRVHMAERDRDRLHALHGAGNIDELIGRSSTPNDPLLQLAAFCGLASVW